ncbi:Rne/Rng family ribonuclease [Rickettsia rickettsii]|uniref:Ribonuclease G n=2 Tax=Rickettsia rickettsii TaxID=783 RepID=B0BWT0_RICRO|nr:Rne/Rng family ribonuclease [Rickettsia rickettsii]ABV75954.1 ribonuclease E [Rickettsia rickettsii str. 'Sheila Smith']ABY72306.1 ribonuclease E [Rickettsia rickettsii str. Iowa]AFB22478.1 ribonuclease E [Rickettsia rickettsii str. Brazil]AFB23285.1 ribonuclease E [Rickettsia rickettsii str. Colombia]AFB24638.1 ribonuclease E [Rickettsia rickettsii str. Arizona]
MNKKIIIDANFPSETRVVLLGQSNNIEDIEFQTTVRQQNKGNIYLAKVTRIEPSLQAVFIEYGMDKSGFLPFSEIHPNYYNLPTSERNFPVNAFPEIALSNITVEDDKEKPAAIYDALVDSEEIDLKTIEDLVESKFQSELNLEAADDIEMIQSGTPESNIPQYKQYKVQEVIRKNQILLVQVTKEERGSKCAAFTTYISLAGKYCVLMPNKGSQNGISRKISNGEERKRLKDILNKIVSGDKNAYSVIVRTAGRGSSTLDLKKDYNYLARLWNKIRKSTIKFPAPCFIHEEDGIIRKTIRDMCDHNVKEVVIQGQEGYEDASKFMQDLLPSELVKLKEHKSKTPIFTKFQVEEQLVKLYQPVVTLPSGGYIVINPTEALIAIDVNSGKSTSEQNIEETALKTNLEAAQEVAKQVKLRDLSGLIVVDFIDMSEAKNRKIIERSFKEFLSRDRARIQTGNISQFGLLEFSRQRLRSSFLETNSAICSHCNGKGVIRASDANAMLILRTIENEIFEERIDVINVFTNIVSVIYLLNNKRAEIKFIEEKYNIKLNFYSDPHATSDSYSIEKVKLFKKNNNNFNSVKPVIQNHNSDYTEEELKKEQLRKNKHKWKTANNSNNVANEVKDKSLEAEESVEQTVSVVEEVKVVESNAGLEEAQAAPKKTKRRYRNKTSNKKCPSNTVEDTEKNAES